MASESGGAKEDKSESRRDRAITRYLVPILVAWLLAVAGLAGWHYSTSEIVELGGKLAVVASAGLAFLAVVLAAVQDAVPVGRKQKWLFPGATHPFPSFEAFSEEMMRKARVSAAKLSSLEDFKIGVPKDHESQDELWYSAFKRHEEKFAVAQFSARHIVWRDAFPLTVFLAAVTATIAMGSAVVGSPAQTLRWLVLAIICVLVAMICGRAGQQANIGLVIEVLKALGEEAGQARSTQAVTPAPDATAKPGEAE